MDPPFVELRPRPLDPVKLVPPPACCGLCGNRLERKVTTGSSLILFYIVFFYSVVFALLRGICFVFLPCFGGPDGYVPCRGLVREGLASDPPHSIKISLILKRIGHPHIRDLIRYYTGFVS